MAALRQSADPHRRAGLVVCIAGILTLAALAALGTSLHGSQARAREAITGRFAERAGLSASLTESIFASAASASLARNTELFSAPHVSVKTLTAEVVRSRLITLVLLRSDGTIMASSPRTPPAVLRGIEGKAPFVRTALSGRNFSLSDVIKTAGAPDMIQFAQPLVTPSGRRVLISGFSPRMLSGFVSGYLTDIPNAVGGRAYVLDGRGSAVGGTNGAMPGLLVAERGLVDAAARAREGRFGDGRYFAASPVANSRWRVVLTTRESTLFASVEGAGKWVPWMLFAAFGLVAAAALALVGRVVRSAELLRQVALHDALTGLPNRRLFLDRVSASLARNGRDGEHRCAVLFLDLDRFKLVNDSFSHAVGDELLVALGRRLSAVLRPDDVIARGGPEGFIARLGGDEFTILLENLDAQTRAEDVARRIQAALQEPFRVQERELFVSASIGMSISQPGSSALDLMRNADIAMYDAKRQGNARVSIFTDEMHGHVVDQIELESELRSVIENRTLQVFYQPVVNLASGEIAGYEALARWPAGQPAVPPSRFIAVAEDTGQIADLGRLVLQAACERLSDWRRRGIVDGDQTMSINVSGRQLSDPQRLVTDVKAALASSGLPPRCLRLEITESTVISRPDRARIALDELAQLGVLAEIDDFGTGYASLTVLQSFPGDTLKIDRSFIAAMHDTDSQAAIVRGIVVLAHNLGMHVIAEGIEDHRQLALLRSIGCGRGQGYLFGRPADGDELEPIIVAWDPARFAAAAPQIPA